MRKAEPIRLVVFDMDGVLADVDSSWMFVHQAFNVSNELNYQRYVRGEIGYQEFLNSDIRLWGRVTLQRIEEILAEIPLMPGAEETVKALKLRKVKTAIISSGLEPLAKRIQRELTIDHVYANRLLVDEDGFLTGEGEALVEPKEKLKVLMEVSSRLGLRLSECAVVGDSLFDIPMLKAAGVGIAFNPKDKEVSEAADFVVEEKNLKAVLPPIFQAQIR